MPITYRFDRDSATLQSKATGVMTMADLLEYLGEVVADPDIGPEFVELVDFAGIVDLKISYSELDPLTAVWQRYIEKGCLATVVLATRDMPFGIARMMQMVITSCEEGGVAGFIVTRTPEEARTAIEQAFAASTSSNAHPMG